MSKVSAPPESLDQHLQPGETEQADYLAWRDAKVSRALGAADKHPEKRRSQQSIWRKFGLER